MLARASLSLLLGVFIIAVPGVPTRAAGPVTAAAMAADGNQIVLGSQHGIEVRSWPDRVVTGTLPTGLMHVHDLSFSPDGRTLLAAGGAPAEEGVVEVWNWADGSMVRRVAAHQDVVYRVAWAPDGKRWATAGADAICQVFDAQSGASLCRYEGHSRGVLAVRYLPDGQRILSAGIDQTLRLWDSSSGEHLRTLDNHVGSINDIAVRPSGASHPGPAIVATISEDATVRLWQPEIGRLMRFARLPSVPRAMTWSATGERLFVASNDGRVRALDPDSAQVVDQWDALQGRAHELLMEIANQRLLVAGETTALVPSGLHVLATQ